MKIPLSPPSLVQLLDQIQDLSTVLGRAPLVDGRYQHWDELRHRNPPKDLTHEEWWAGIKLARQSQRQLLPFLDTHDRPMHFTQPDPVQRALHNIDRQAAGNVAASSPMVSEGERERYLVSSLIEEAITSSQLEGASTTQEVAKDMLRSGRKPRDRSERMILNNYQVMQMVRELRDEPLTPDLLLQMHRIVTDGTLETPGAAGRVRRPDERVRVMDAQHSTVLHEPPDARGLADRIERLCRFANQGEEPQPFIHPVIRAILLHFALGYDHPFVDGNGRTARALFYWSMARSGYWLMEYVSISRLLKETPAKYARAYLHAETDDNDTTYFLIHQLGVIEQAIKALHDYLGRKSREQASTEALLRHAPRLSDQLNHRQVALLSHALRHTGHGYTVASHQRSHQVTPQTARTDLLSLVDLELLEKAKRGRAFVFYAPGDLRARIQQAAGA